jgi:hypothetical protein
MPDCFLTKLKGPFCPRKDFFFFDVLFKKILIGLLPEPSYASVALFAVQL